MNNCYNTKRRDNTHFEIDKKYDDDSSDSDFSDGFDGRLDEEFNQIIKTKMKGREERAQCEDGKATTKRFSRSPTFLRWVACLDAVEEISTSPKQQNLIGKTSTEITKSSRTSTVNEPRLKRFSKSPTFLRWDALALDDNMVKRSEK